VKRFLGFLAALFLTAPSLVAAPEVHYIRNWDGNNTCLGTDNSAWSGAGDTSCAFKDFGYAMSRAPKECGDHFVLVDNPDVPGPTRFFASKFDGAGALLSNWTSSAEFANSDNCTETTRIVIRSSTEDANDVIITSFVPVTETITRHPNTVDFPNVWQFTNSSNGEGGGTLIWPAALFQDGPDTNHTKFYLNGEDEYYGFFDNAATENCLVGPDITTNGLPALNKRHHIWLSGIPGQDSTAPIPGSTGGVVYFHPQTNEVLANGPDTFGTPASGNGGNPTTGAFQMYKRIREKTFFVNQHSGIEIRNLSFEGPVRFGGNFTYVHDNKFRNGNIEFHDNAVRSGDGLRGGLTKARYQRNENETAKFTIFSTHRTSEAGHQQGGWKITDNRMWRSFSNVLRPEFIAGTDTDHGLIARNTLGPSLSWYKNSGAAYQCLSGTWLRPYSNDHILFIGSGAAPLQALHYTDIVNNTLYGSQEGIGSFYSHDLLVDGNLFARPISDGTDYGTGGTLFPVVGQGYGFCGNNHSSVTLVNNVFWRAGLDDGGVLVNDFDPGIFILGQGAGTCITAIDGFPVADYNLYIHPEEAGDADTILCDTRPTPELCYTLVAADTAGYEGSNSIEVDDGPAGAGMMDPDYDTQDYRLSGGAPQINNGHPSICGHGVCDGGTAPADTVCYFDDSPVGFPDSDLARCPGGGTCIIRGAACDMGPYEYIPSGIQDPPGGARPRPDLRYLNVRCASDICVGTGRTGPLENNVFDGFDPELIWFMELCYRKVSDGGIDNEAELALATCAVTDNEVYALTGNGGDNKLEVSGLDDTTDYVWVARIHNQFDATVSDVDEDIAMAVVGSTGSVDTEVDCTNITTLQGVIDDICDGSRDVDLNEATEPLNCIPKAVGAEWASGLTIPATCLHTAIPVAITFSGSNIVVTADPVWWEISPTECPSSSCGDCDCNDDGFPDQAQEDEDGLTGIDVRSSYHVISDFTFTGFKDGVRLDGRSATDGVTEVTLSDTIVKYPGDDCFSMEAGAGQQDADAGNVWANLTCENTLDKGYQIYGIPTNTAGHTDNDLSGTNLTCKNCVQAFRFSGPGRWALSGLNVYNESGPVQTSSCSNGIRQDDVTSYLTLDNSVINGCRWGVRVQGGAHARIDNTVLVNNGVTGMYFSGAATKVVVEDMTISYNGGSTSSLVGYGGVSVAADATASTICLGSCTENMDFTNADPTGTAKVGLGRNKFEDNFAPSLGLIDLYSLNASVTTADQNCFGLTDSDPAPRVFGPFDTDPIWAACGGVSGGAGGGHSPSGRVFLSRSYFGGPEVAGAPITVAGGTSGDTACGALSPVRTCTSAVTTAFAAATCVSTTGTRTVLCEE
jgi:hypothetical protein